MRSRRQTAAGQAAPTIDRTYGLEPPARALAALASHEWRLAHELLEVTRDAHEREVVVDILASGAATTAALDDWVSRAGSGSALPWLVRGAHRARRAWAARVDGGFRPVILAGDPTIELIDEAELDLDRAIEIDAGDPTPWTQRVLTGRARQATVAELVERFEEADQRERHLAFAHDELLQGLSPRWHPDDDVMLQFATVTSDDAPEGSPLHRAVPRALLEQHWWLHDKPRQQEAMLADPDVLAAIRAAADRSVDSVRFGDGPQALITRNTFALAFNVFGDPAAAHAQFVAIGDRPTPEPWEVFGEGAPGAFRRQRDIAAGAARQA
jgi:hypothetical protein